MRLPGQFAQPADRGATARRLRDRSGAPVEGLTRTERRGIQTLHWQVDGNGQNAAEVALQLAAVARDPAIDRVLVDSKMGTAAGGTGISFHWNSARAVFAQAQSKLILAGGLRPEASRSDRSASSMGSGCGQRCGKSSGEKGQAKA